MQQQASPASGLLSFCLCAAGEGVLRIQDTLRMRIACSESINATLTALRTAPRPAAFPGTQQVSLEDIQYRGRTYPDSVHVEDVALFVSPGDVEDAAYYAGRCALFFSFCVRLGGCAGGSRDGLSWGVAVGLAVCEAWGF